METNQYNQLVIWLIILNTRLKQWHTMKILAKIWYPASPLHLISIISTLFIFDTAGWWHSRILKECNATYCSKLSWFKFTITILPKEWRILIWGVENPAAHKTLDLLQGMEISGIHTTGILSQKVDGPYQHSLALLPFQGSHGLTIETA